MKILKDINLKKELCLASNCNDFLSDRVEKITMAVYLVTELLSDTEPLKFRLRNRNIKLMSFIKDDRKAVSIIEEIDSLLKIALMAGLISKMNYSILNVEYGKLLNLVKGNKQVVLPDELFADSKGHLKGHYQGQSSTSFRKQIKDISSKNKTKKIKKVLNANKQRKENIINFIKDKKEVSIKDIAKVINDCSEKTLQREIVSLIEEGVLKKEGEKRWTKYSIKN